MQETSVQSLGFEKIPWRRKWQPTPVFLPGKSHGQRRLADYSPSIGSRRVWYNWATELLPSPKRCNVFTWRSSCEVFVNSHPGLCCWDFFLNCQIENLNEQAFFFLKLSSCVYFKSYRLYRKHNYLTKCFFIWNKHCYIFIPSFSLHSPCVHCRSGCEGWKGYKDGPCDPFPQIALDLMGKMGWCAHSIAWGELWQGQTMEAQGMNWSSNWVSKACWSFISWDGARFSPETWTECAKAWWKEVAEVGPQANEFELYHIGYREDVSIKLYNAATFLAVQWLSDSSACPVVKWFFCLSGQGTQVQPLVWEGSAGWGATKPMCHNHWSPRALEPMFCDKRSHCKEKPVPTAKGGPHSLQLEKVQPKQQRPRAAKNKF